MTERVTRSQTGRTPRKSLPPGFVETPTRQRRSRRTGLDDDERHDSALALSDWTDGAKPRGSSEESNGRANGVAKVVAKTAEDAADVALGEADHIEFGGTLGVTALIIGFPLLMYYMWIGATFYDGRLPLPTAGEGVGSFLQHLAHLVYMGAFPSLKAWSILWGFFVFEAVCYLVLPGVYVKGKPLPHEGGRQLEYYCSGLWSFHVTTAVAMSLHASGLFSLYTIMDQFGPIMSVAIISGFAISVAAYASALRRGKQHRMTGQPVYDFFMGAELNPRLFGKMDFKMFFEVRLPWYILYLLSLGTAARQYEQLGYVSGEVAFCLMAHFIYANACSKGEDMIVTTWDMYYEKWGFMLIFWNIAGVPFSYCHCTIFLANHDPETYRWSKPVLAAFFASYLFVTWVWDTANCQKNSFRAQERGHFIDRKGFPHWPYSVVKDPKTIPTKTGDSILCDGWYGKARKINYTCDAFFALSWAAITGFQSPFPWFYPTFFVVMIAHRAHRDIQRCRERYGEAWAEYERRVPYLFIPYVF